MSQRKTKHTKKRKNTVTVIVGLFHFKSPDQEHDQKLKALCGKEEGGKKTIFYIQHNPRPSRTRNDWTSKKTPADQRDIFRPNSSGNHILRLKSSCYDYLTEC